MNKVNENQVPPIVVQMVGNLAQAKEQWARINILMQLRAIRDYCDSAIKKYERTVA